MLSFRYQQISAVHKSKPKLAHLRTHLRDVMMQGGENYGPACKKSLFDFSSLLLIKKFFSGIKLISLLPAPLRCTCATPLLSAGLRLFSRFTPPAPHPHIDRAYCFSQSTSISAAGRPPVFSRFPPPLINACI